MLQRKLAAYATTIGKLGLGAAVLATAAMAARFTAGVVSAGGEPWSWAYAPEYLRILTTGVTILVRVTIFALRRASVQGLTVFPPAGAAGITLGVGCRRSTVGLAGCVVRQLCCCCRRWWLCRRGCRWR